MAPSKPCSLRAVQSRCISFSLARFERSLCESIGEPARAEPGTPGGGRALLTDGPRQALTSYLLAEILSKFDDGKVNPAKDHETWNRFHEAERLCFETNHRLQAVGFNGPYQRVISHARKIASQIMGRFDWDAAARGFGWGPGSSTRLPRRLSDAAYKFSGNPESTYGNAVLADAAIRHIPLWKQELDKLGPSDVGYCKIVPGNRIITVPKNYKTDRTIAVEPDMNMYVQKGIGALLRRRLKAAGCDLDDQTRNQRLSRVGAITGRLATIDLSMASDTVSRVLVSKFIRPDWLEALEQSRCPFGVLPSGEKIFYQKFSSMGNGFTFELESVIFYSLALACTLSVGEEVSRVAVYGDDIVIPSAAADTLYGALSTCGFVPNVKKSYTEGPFRESCGKHYYLEHDISPFYVRRDVKTLTDLFLLHNNVFRWQERSLDLLGGRVLDPLLKELRALAPAKWRKPRLLDGFGDGAFIGDLASLDLRVHPGGWEAWVVDILSQSSEDVMVDIPGLLIKALDLLERPRNRPIAESRVHPSRMGRVRTVRVTIPFTPQYALEKMVSKTLIDPLLIEWELAPWRKPKDQSSDSES